MDVGERLISRGDLLHSDESSGESNDTAHYIRRALDEQLGSFDVSKDVVNQENEPLEEKEEEELEFRLFASGSTTTKIRVKSPDLSDRLPGFVVASRPQTYYFATSPTSDEDAAYRSSALSGQQILELSRLPWPGCSLPWRVKTVAPQGKVIKQTILGHGTKTVASELKSRRTKPGKKARIAKWKKSAAREKEALKLQEKEKALREKKTKKNRSQKVKRREKKRNEKAAAATEGEVLEQGPN